ncbi:hypothetical protein ACXR2T_08005 [Leucobacter sp. HY1910]
MTDNQEISPTDAQVEAAAMALAQETPARSASGWRNLHEFEQEKFRTAAGAALVAAAVAAPAPMATASGAATSGDDPASHPRIFARPAPGAARPLNALHPAVDAHQAQDESGAVEASDCWHEANCRCAHRPAADQLAAILREGEAAWHLSDEKSQQSHACGAPDLKSKYLARFVLDRIEGQRHG